MSNDKNIWGIHGGRSGEADSIFLKKGVIALGWDKMGDVSKLNPNREAYKVAFVRAYPDKKAAAVPGMAGQIFRFATEMQKGDLIVYPSKRDRQIHLGIVESNYLYDAQPDATFPHQRSVKWLRSVPRTRFTQGALYEIGSAMSFFQVKNYADEFRTAVEGKTAPAPVEHDESIAAVSEDIEETTRDFIIKRLAQETEGRTE